MTIQDAQLKINQTYDTTLASIKKNSSTITSFADELSSQLKKSSQTETTSSEQSDVDAFKKDLSSMGALAFFQEYNNTKIEKMMQEKEDELKEKLGLGDDANPPLTGEDRTNALASLEKLLEDYRKNLIEKMSAEDKLEKQNSTLSTFLQQLV